MDTDFKFTSEPGKQEFLITSVFNAPRELVFMTFINPNLLPEWWGPKYLTTIIDRIDARPDGTWRYIQKDKKGNTYAFHGVFHDVSFPERIIQTFEYEGTPGHVILETITFEEFNGKTKITEHSVFQTVDDRDEMVAEDCEKGSSESMSRFAELLSKITKSS
jgi:uncharacterized protein YndB with AHSA1/START domain